MARRVAGRRGPSATVILVLVGFLLVATGVIWRRSEGLARAQAHQALERRRDALVAQQRRLESDVREAASRNRIVPAVEARLGMHVPSATQLIYLTPTTPVDSARDTP